MNELASVWFLVALGIAAAAFVITVVFHPASRRSSVGETSLSITWSEASVGTSRLHRSVAGALVTYGFIVGAVSLALAKLRTGWNGGVSTEELGPIGNTAFTLLFAAIAWLSGRGGLSLKARMKADGTWFR